MNLIDLDIHVPDIFHDVFSRVKRLGPMDGFAVIAGGAPCNHYMNKPIRDIDVFIDFDVTEEELQKVFKSDVNVTVRHIYAKYSGWNTAPDHFNIKYKGYDIDIIPTYRDRVLDFDLRFRQFYFLGGRIIASQEALSDIEKKELVVVNPISGYSTFTRVFRFQEQFGFCISKQSMDFLKWAFQFHDITATVFFDRVNSDPKLNDSLRNTIRQYVLAWKMEENQRLYDNYPFPFHPALEERVKTLIHAGAQYSNEHSTSIGVSYECIINYKPIEPVTIPLTLTYKHLLPSIEKLDKIVRFVRLQSLFTDCDIPSIRKNELETRWQEYITCDIASKFDDALFIVGAKPPFFGHMHVTIEENLEDLIPPIDYLTGNSMILCAGEMEFYLRKCSNGKYTLSGIADNETLKGSGFFLEAIGAALKEQYPQLFDFYNPELLGVYSYSGTVRTHEQFFDNDAQPSFLNSRQKEYLRPIKLISSKKRDD